MGAKLPCCLLQDLCIVISVIQAHFFVNCSSKPSAVMCMLFTVNLMFATVTHSLPAQVNPLYLL